GATPAEIRLRARSGGLSGPTAGLAAGYQQANIVILPQEAAGAFLDYVRANPRACPLLAVGEPGNPRLPALGKDIDMRTDLPRYRLFRDGAPSWDVTDIAELWRDDLVTFALGCSLGFAAALDEAGIALRCHAPGANCSAFDSAIETAAA